MRSVMPSLSRFLPPALTGVVVLWLAAQVLAQPASDAAALSRAYAALAAGRAAEAQRVAEQLLADFRALNYDDTLPARPVFDQLLLTAHNRVRR